MISSYPGRVNAHLDTRLSRLAPEMSPGAES